MKQRWRGRFVTEGKRARLEALSEKSSRLTEDEEETDHSPEIDEDTTTESGWSIGRRIVELGHIAQQMKSCKNCSNPLHLHKIVKEQRAGYASILYISCDCGIMNSVTTGKSHRPSDKLKKGMPVYDINTKAVLGAMHAGVNYRQMNALMATMEIKGLHHTTMMRRREEIEPHVQSVAEDSCLSTLRMEVNNGPLSSSNTEPDGSTNTPQLEGIFKYDMGWQKRGSGRAYDSKSGVGTLIGNNTGRICAYGVRVSDCRMCSNAKRDENENVPPHKCSKNWTGSAKAMEPDVGINLIKLVEKEGVKVSTIIMDDDTTTMARIRKELTHSVIKWSDINHTSKHLSNSLFQLQKKHKCLTNHAIAYLKKCFNYALAQTKSNAELCKHQIEQIVPHSFGEHDKCGDWCGFKSNPDEYKHRTLTQDLAGGELRSDLEAIFNVFSQNSEKIAPGASTKDVESFNNMVATKAPKRCHFSASGNLQTRVSCAVAQKNMGNSYVNAINEKVGLSPGRIYFIEAERRDTERKRQKIYVNKKETKLRKLQKKLRKKLDLCSKEKKEGTTYQTGIANDIDSDTSIPPHEHEPVSEPVQNLENLVFCDIETGSLHKDCDILQIAACAGEKKFNVYIRPTKTISPGASKVTGLTSLGGVLFLNGSPVGAVPLKDALNQLISWLGNIGNAVLVGHNFKVFDFPRLTRAIWIVGLEKQFKAVCLGCADTLPIFRMMFPDADNHRQEYLVHHVLNEHYSAHNALDDVLSLEKLFTHASPPIETTQKHSFSAEWAFKLLVYQGKKAVNLATLQYLLDQKVVTKQSAAKIAGSGLCLSHLKATHTQHGATGLAQLLSENTSGAPRVTGNKKIIEKINNYFLVN